LDRGRFALGFGTPRIRLAVRHARRRVAAAAGVVVTDTNRRQGSQLYAPARLKAPDSSKLAFSIAIRLYEKWDQEQSHQDDHHENAGGKPRPLKRD
jgi:hypothetical protein